MRKFLKGAVIAVAGLFLWTAQPLTAKPAPLPPAASRLAEGLKKPKKPSKNNRRRGRQVKRKKVHRPHLKSSDKR